MGEATFDSLPELVRALSRKYPGVTVEAFIRNDERGRCQTTTFNGPTELLVRFGLAEAGKDTDRIDEYGTLIMADGRRESAHVVHHHHADTGQTHAWRCARSHAENEKTRYAVARILKRLRVTARNAIRDRPA